MYALTKDVKFNSISSAFEMKFLKIIALKDVSDVGKNSHQSNFSLKK